MKFTARQIAEMLQGRVDGNPDTTVWTLARIEDGTPGGISFLANPKYTPYVYTTASSVVIVNEEFVAEKPISCTLVRVPDAYSSFGRLLELYNQIRLDKTGISAQAEIDRTKALMAEAKKQGMKIIGLHIGGEGRRGELSDKFLVDTVPACDYVIVVADGNKDGLFTKLAGSKVPLDTVEKITKVSDPLVKAFK